MRSPIALGAAGVVAFFVLMTVTLGSWYTIDEGERGVTTRSGQVTGVADPGLGFKLPLLDDVTLLSLRSQLAQYPGMAAYSRDQQAATMQVSVNFRIAADRVIDVYTQYGSLEGMADRMITPRINQQLETVFGTFSAQSAVQDRAGLNRAFQQAIDDALGELVIVEGVQIENIDFSDAYEQSIEARMLAEVEVARRQQNLATEQVQAQIAVTQAQAAADSRVAQATAEAEATRLQGEAQAAAIRARAEALGQNPELVQLTIAERWNGALPSTMLPGDSVPMLQLPQ